MLIASLGEQSHQAQQCWRNEIPHVEFVSLVNPSQSGRRLGSRVLGIGLDAALLGPKLRNQKTILATNPWVGVVAKAVRTRELAVTGLYAEPGTRSWRFLRKILADAPVVTTSTSESCSWNVDGGRSEPVLWGGTFNLPTIEASNRFQIFVGGTSDRDTRAVNALVDEIRCSDASVTAVIADGSGPRSWNGPHGTVRWLPFVNQQTFLRELARSSVSWIPLRPTRRAAGHMVLAASLQAGVPVIATDSPGIREYLEAAGITGQRARPSIRDFRVVADSAEPDRLKDIWANKFSTKSYTSAVAKALDNLGWPGLT